MKLERRNKKTHKYTHPLTTSKIIAIIAVILISIDVLLRISDFFGYSVSINNFDASLGNWDHVASLISLVTLFLLYKNLDLTKKTIKEMKQQRLDSVKPKIVLSQSQLSLNVFTNKYLEFYIQNSSRICKGSSFFILNIGQEGCVNLKIDILLARHRVKADYKKILNFIDKNIPNNALKNSLKTKHFGTRIEHALEVTNQIVFDCLMASKKEEHSLPTIFEDILIIYSIYSLFSTKDDLQISFPMVTLRAAYEDILGNKFVDLYSMTVYCDLDEYKFKQYISNNFAGMEKYQEKAVSTIGLDKNMKYMNIGNYFIEFNKQHL